VFCMLNCQPVFDLFRNQTRCGTVQQSKLSDAPSLPYPARHCQCCSVPVPCTITTAAIC
jgi:hypothetical protein